MGFHFLICLKFGGGYYIKMSNTAIDDIKCINSKLEAMLMDGIEQVVFTEEEVTSLERVMINLPWLKFVLSNTIARKNELKKMISNDVIIMVDGSREPNTMIMFERIRKDGLEYINGYMRMLMAEYDPAKNILLYIDSGAHRVICLIPFDINEVIKMTGPVLMNIVVTFKQAEFLSGMFQSRLQNN
jgi:hypothetical protein